MESTQQTSSVILKLMGLDKVPPEHTVPDKEKVLSDEYQQKVASIGVIRKKRSSRPQYRSSGMSADEKEESEEVLKVVKTIRRDKHHNPSNGYGKENPHSSETKVKGLPQQFMDAKNETFNSRISVTESNHGKGVNGLRYVSLPSSCKNSRLADALLRELFCSKIMRVYPEMTERKKISCGNDFQDQSSRSFIKTLEKVSVQTGQNAANRVLDTVSSLFSRGNEAFPRSSDMPKPASNISVNERHGQGFGVRSINNQSAFSNDKTKMKYSRARKTAMTGPLHAASVTADNLRTTTKDNSFERYWGLRKNASANWSTLKSKNRSINMKACSEDSSMNTVAPNSSVNGSVSDVTVEAVSRSHNNNSTVHQSESTAFDLSCGDSDSLSHHSSSASTQQDAYEFQEDSACSLFSGTEPDSLGSFDGAYEPSPVSVLVSSFREDISSNLKVVDTDEYYSSEVDDEGFGMNVSSDEDCGDESFGECEEKKDLVGIFGSEESRNFSYVVDVLTEAGISNRSLFTNFSTWHSSEYPISPSVFEALEKKFGEQQFWRRSERRLLFDRINVGLLEILRPFSYVPTWEKPVSRRLNDEPSQNMVEEMMWGLLVAQEKKAGKDSEDNMLGGEISWIELGENIEDIVIEIVKLLIEELANEIVSF